MSPTLLTSLATAVTLSSLGTLLYYYFYITPSKSRNPRGPPGLPIIGNLLDVPVVRPWVQFAQWQKQYGGLVPLRIFRRRLFVVNTKEVAVELFEKRSAIYSERPYRPMAALCGFTDALLFHGYDDRTRKTRKYLHAEIGQHAAEKHKEIQEREVLLFVQRIMEDPHGELIRDTRRLAASIILMVSYGYKVKGDNDPFVILAEQVMTYVGLVITPNNFLVDSLPFLKYIPEWFPGAQFQREARKCRHLLQRMMDEPFAFVKENMKKDPAIQIQIPDNLVSRTLEQGLTEEEEDVLKWTAGSLYSAGSHSTVGLITSFFLTMILHPHIQRRAQKELDDLLSSNAGGSGERRLPRFSDRKSLRYVECVMLEVMRWRPTAPLAAHSTTVDDVYDGIFIPAGSVVMANSWAYTHDEDVYDNPDVFLPDRFLSTDSQSGSDCTVPRDPRSLIFGFGRRYCPGQYILDNLLWLVIAVSLTTLDILPELDEDGEEVVPCVEYTSGAVSQPFPFKCRLRPRFADSKELVDDAVEVLG